MARTKASEAARKAWVTRRKTYPRLVQTMPVGFPLRGYAIEMTVTVNCERQYVRFKVPGERAVQLALWAIYDAAGGTR